MHNQTCFFHTEYTSYLPLSCIYFNSGRRPFQPLRARVYFLTAFHANIASVILCAVTVNALSVALDRRVMEGALLASSSGPCGWLSLSLYANGATPLLVGCNYVLSLLTIPVIHLLLCGKAPTPSMEDLKTAAVTAVLPYLVGICGASKVQNSRTTSKLAALVLLYVDCCNLLREAEGALYVSDVFTALVLVASWLSTVAASSYLYVKCTILDINEAQLLQLVATPKSRFDWISSTCPREGLYLLPTVFLAPAQAFLLSSIFFDTDLSNLPE
ncbi:uncharacterized protein LOC125055005 isoform X2 [Pieris napi]|uniref:uncharacterized protein LOC125055005 isoform X2 n=1 Tax=Pieris napi TaxID=78633 RepID=UPI001FBB9F56|nr:uncharacterized protein LOC125055005 isoform X2 [Pieris napi]